MIHVPKLFIDICVSSAAPYQAPGNLTGEATNSTSIFVQWNEVVLPNIRGILRGYTVYYKEAPSSVHPSELRNVSVHISVTEAELVNLHKFTEYHIWVTAFTTRDGMLSNSIFIRTHEDSKLIYLLFVSLNGTCCRCYLFSFNRNKTLRVDLFARETSGNGLFIEQSEIIFLPKL